MGFEIILAGALALAAAALYFFKHGAKPEEPVFGPPPPPLTLEEKIRNEIRVRAAHQGIPFDLIVAQIKKESGGGSRIDNTAALGRDGEIGLLQIKPVVLTDYNRTKGTNHNVEKLWNFDFNIEVGTWYLAKLKERFGSWRSALIAYNIGPTKFARDGETPQGSSYASTILNWAGLA